MSEHKLLNCFNRGCGQTFDPENNNDDSCRHHPGNPFFHDAYKGWSCCNKKSVDFTEFLNIKGCTLSKHSNVKPPEPEKPPKDESAKDEVVVVRAPIREAMERPPIDTPMVAIQATVAPALKEAIGNFKVKIPNENDVNHLEMGKISIGMSCKNSGCTYSYTESPSDDGECRYHSGVPIFHEGMKFWSCCQKKTTDFGEFMAQKGCVYGQHKWINENDHKKDVKCRYDWHQTATNVIVVVYAKMNDYGCSVIEVNPIRLHVHLVFPQQDNGTFDLDLELRGVIDVHKTTAHMTATKVEITMAKAEPGTWAKLDFPGRKLPPAQAKSGRDDNANKERRNSDSDDGFNLDDIESVKPACTIRDISEDKINQLD